jgi:excisionase family DNA binding protein
LFALANNCISPYNLGMSTKSNILTVRQAADELGVKQSRVHQLIRAGILPACKFGWVWLIHRADLAGAMKRRRQRGPVPQPK